MSKMNEFIEALRKGSSYGWIANNGYNLSKYELIDIIKEYDYAIHISATIDSESYMYNVVADNLELMYEEEC